MGRTLLILVALLPVPAGAEPPAWQLAGSLGMLQFVVVSEARARDRALYDEAIAALCPQVPTCFLRFFTNSTGAPLVMPLPDEILAEPTATYQRSAKQGNELFQWSCRLGIPGGNCF
ncbi:MAG TPA: hypothetical protein VLC55_06575 [Burkholderiales bacterium]|nr:hypothetical protein [Burkholderiales bacterium]